MRDTKVLISGASIGGPVLAFWLARYGATVTVVEQAPALRDGGQLIDLRGKAAYEVLERSGFMPAVQAARTKADGLSLVGADGRRQASAPSDGFNGSGPVAAIEILRGDLFRIFYDATRDDVEYVFGDRIAALDDRPDGVRVTFESGQERDFDLVVGADGLHSGVRRLLFGDEGPLVRHLGMYLAFWTVKNHLGLRNWTELYSEPGRTVMMRAIKDNSAAMAFSAFLSPAFRYDYRDLETLKTVVRSRIAGMGWEAERMVGQIDDAGDFYFDSASQVLLPAWSQGRIALVGDAAYCASPLSGHGTTIAMVGAYVLAGELARADGDHAAAFRSYEARLRPWIEEIQRFGRGAGARMTTPRTELGILFRRAVLRGQELLPKVNFAMPSAIQMSDRFVLPEYPLLQTNP